MISIRRIQLMGYTSAGHGVSGTDLVWCVSTLDIPRASVGRPHQALNLLGEVRFISWPQKHPFLGECRRGHKHFWECRANLSYGFALGPTLKSPCTTLVRLVGRLTNTTELVVEFYSHIKADSRSLFCILL